MITTFALLNAGNYQGRGALYVAAVAAQIRRHCTGPHQVVCFSDDEQPIDGVKLRELPIPGLKGWWHKISLFKAGVFEPGERVWYVDLDTMIVGPLDFLAGYDGQFAMLDSWGFSDINPIFDGPQSSVMAWRGGFGAEIWDKFVSDGYPNTPGGDQRFISDMDLGPDLLQQLFPGRFASYKQSCIQRVPDGVSVCCHHGLPRPHQAGGWARQLWRDSTADLR